MPGIGHNNGPTMENGRAWRRHCWTKARKDLLPQLPLEVIRLRMKRARQLGLPFATYNRVRATTGQDIVAFLFSTNALRMIRAVELEEEKAEKLRSIVGCKTLVAAQPPLDAEQVNARLLDAGVSPLRTLAAPIGLQSHGQIARQMRSLLKEEHLPGDRVLVIGETALEKEWCAAGRMAGFVSGEVYFAHGS